MKPVRLVFLGILFLVSSPFVNAFGQQEFMQSGVVFENGSKIRIALAEVTNLRNGYSVGSNDMGLFSIKSAIGDTLVVIKRGFNDIRVVVSSTKDIILQLNRGGTMLSEVVINGQGKKQALDAIKRDFKNKGSFYGGKPPLLSYVLSPLTAVYELFGRTPKNARRFNKMYVSELQDSHVDQLFNKTTINKETGLTGKELEDFMVNYRPDYEKAKNWTYYDSTKWIKDSFKNYTDTLKKKN
ncbi:hypothetical protein EZ428_03885 [Pedobacter frigiditerrae]|uniref:CarboxypepD_reg-like domain-containing protein n=1 Tax=Pedobacter frigiditerrae TaxID=2530452 RepID=A0A4R0N5N4_9SPHI|nr:hypothetical protein [Pedobacter frigiditerrae]TCC93922.1 hypothetical protein EZ428_03885 [Pedobacter frigiditerrae]